MRIGLLSDLHGNLLSLDSVLADLERQDVDRVICLGDVATLGPQPSGVIARLKELECPCVMGNHETYLLDEASLPTHADLPAWMVEQIRWCAEQLSSEAVDFLRSFRPKVEITLGRSCRLTCVHGSPRSNEEMILSTTPERDLDCMLEGLNSTVLAVGHSHVQMARRHKGAYIVNPGSVGEPLERMPFVEAHVLPWSEYALLEIEDDRLSIALRRVPINLKALIREFEQCGMPGAEIWIEYWRAAGGTAEPERWPPLFNKQLL